MCVTDDSHGQGVEGYGSAAQTILDRILETQQANIEQTAALVATVAQRNSVVYTFGSGHSSLVALEFCERAGGLACFEAIRDPLFGKAERLEGFATMLLQGHPMTPQDALIIVSNSGRNALPIEMALAAKTRHIATVAITSLEHSRQVASRHSSGLKLYDICDIVIDTCSKLGDAVLKMPGMDSTPVGATSTLAGVFIANCITVLAVSQCLNNRMQPQVFISANLDNSDDKNRALFDRTRRRAKGAMI